MTLMQTWRDSLLVIPQQFKLFFMVTAKASIDTYHILFTRLWWVVLLDVLLFFTVSLVHDWVPKTVLVNFLYLFVSQYFLFFMLVLAIRPSVLKKDNAYFLSYWFYFLFLLLFMAALYLVLTALFLFKLGFLKPIFMIQTPFVVSPLVIFFTLFLLDSDGTVGQGIKSAARSIKMVWYNYPFCLISYTVFCYVLSPLVLWFIDYFSARSIAVFSSVYAQIAILFIARYIYFWLFMPLVLSFMTNFYVKVIYPQLNLYFPVITKDN